MRTAQSDAIARGANQEHVAGGARPVQFEPARGCGPRARGGDRRATSDAVRHRGSTSVARLLILADDFTGACDAAGAFGGHYPTRVITRAANGWPSGAEVLSVDLDARERSNADAASLISNAIQQLGAGHADYPVFIKIDSTLRGPIAGLVEGALAATARSLAVVAPAFPEQGRSIRHGRLVVDGHLGLSVADLLGRLEHVVVDADGSAALQEVARQAKGHPEWLLVGSAGLARQMAPPHRPRSLPTGGSGPILVVAGSPTPVTRAQVDRLRPSAELMVLSTPPAEKRDSGQAAVALAEKVGEWARRHTPRAVVLTGGATAREVSHRLGATSLRVLGELQPGIPAGTLEDGVWHGVKVVTKAGGFGTPDTLLDVVRALGVSSSADAHDLLD
ncbi:MAG: hypothetical protein JOZ87_26600 [Chloroflexi bacterium]|nr:hypothetical protein [Chloroflexota bacterium]